MPTTQSHVRTTHPWPPTHGRTPRRLATARTPAVSPRPPLSCHGHRHTYTAATTCPLCLRRWRVRHMAVLLSRCLWQCSLRATTGHRHLPATRPPPRARPPQRHRRATPPPRRRARPYTPLPAARPPTAALDPLPSACHTPMAAPARRVTGSAFASHRRLTSARHTPAASPHTGNGPQPWNGHSCLAMARPPMSDPWPQRPQAEASSRGPQGAGQRPYSAPQAHV